MVAGGNYKPEKGPGSGTFGAGAYVDVLVGFISIGAPSDYTINVSVGTQASLFVAGSASTGFSWGPTQIGGSGFWGFLGFTPNNNLMLAAGLLPEARSQYL